MTSSPVRGAGFLQNAGIQATPQTTSKTEFADFKNFLSQSKSKLDSISNNVSGINSKQTAVKKQTNEVNADEKEVVKTTEAPNNDKVNPESVTDEQVTEVKEAIETVKDTIKSEFDVTDEEIEAVLEVLGLTQIALLDSETLPSVIVELTGAENVLSIATDENMYQSLNEVSAKVDELITQLSESTEIPVNELNEAIKTFETVSETTSVEMPEEVSEEMTEVISEDVPVETLNAGNRLQSKNEVDEEPVNEENTFESKITVVNKESQNRIQAALENKIETEVTTETKIDTDFRKSENFEQHSSENSTPMTFAQNLMEKVAETLNEEAGQVTYSSIDAQNIMDQITESIKIDLSAETSEVSLRLHPETLGTVSVKVSANNEGVLTAQFIAQNESVKAVIESQAMVLRENLEAKGVTVEAVEVLVQSHEFERNLSEQNKGQNEQNNHFGKRTRRINLIDETDEVSEEDELVKEMMIQNGNTVDYSA